MKLRWGISVFPHPGPYPNPNSATKDEIKEWELRIDEHYDGYLYEQECPKCKSINSVLTQGDNDPEYYTNVKVQCRNCPERIVFSLPVN